MKDENNGENNNERLLLFYLCDVLRTIVECIPKLKNSLDKRDKQQICELLTQMFADNLFVYGRIKITCGANADGLSLEEIVNLRRNLLRLIQ